MVTIRKAVFPVAGLGTRFLPATKSIPKEMMTVIDRPLIQYAVDEAVEAGITILIFVIGRNKRAIEDYFDRNPELEAELERKGKHELLAKVRDVIPKGVQCFYVRQSEPLGLGHAVGCARDMIGDEPFAVFLPDDVIDGASKGAMMQMKACFEATGRSVLAVEEVLPDETERYGIVAPKTEVEAHHGAYFEIDNIVEKPAPTDAPSNWGVVGRYILTPSVMRALDNADAGAGGEIQLTDAIGQTLTKEPVFALPFQGRRFDCGVKEGFLQANIHFGLKRNVARERKEPLRPSTNA